MRHSKLRFPAANATQDDFSEDAEFSSLVSIEPNKNCSQWLSSVSDMKEWAPTYPAVPKRRGEGCTGWKKPNHLYCKTKRNAVKVFACPDTLYRSQLLLIYRGFLNKKKKGQRWVTEGLVWFVKHSTRFLFSFDINSFSKLRLLHKASDFPRKRWFKSIKVLSLCQLKTYFALQSLK